MTATAGVWCYADDAGRAWWGGMWADRILKSDMATTALRTGAASQDDLERLSAGWHEWSRSPDGWFTVPHGEILCRV